MRLLAACAGMLVLGAAVPGSAVAGDYAFSGYFNIGFDEGDIADTRLACAHGFFRQDRDGSFVNYHLDPASYDRDGAIRYVQYNRGRCGMGGDGRIETCKMTFSTVPGEFGSVYIDVVQSIEPDLITMVLVDDLDQARAVLAGETPPGDRSLFVRCPGFTDAGLAGHLTTETSRLESADRDALLSPALDPETRARLQSILDRLSMSP